MTSLFHLLFTLSHVTRFRRSEYPISLNFPGVRPIFKHKKRGTQSATRPLPKTLESTLTATGRQGDNVFWLSFNICQRAHKPNSKVQSPWDLAPTTQIDGIMSCWSHLSRGWFCRLLATDYNSDQFPDSKRDFNFRVRFQNSE